MADTIDDVAAEADVAAESVEQGAVDEAPPTSTRLKRPERICGVIGTYNTHPVAHRPASDGRTRSQDRHRSTRPIEVGSH